MNHKILVVLTCFSLFASCSDEDETFEPEFPKLSKTELNNFLSTETISLKFGNSNWTFSADDMQAAGIRDAGAELNVGATTRHVGGDGHGSSLTGPGHNLGFLLVVLRIEDRVDDSGLLQVP